MAGTHAFLLIVKTMRRTRFVLLLCNLDTRNTRDEQKEDVENDHKISRIPRNFRQARYVRKIYIIVWEKEGSKKEKWL